MQNLPFPLPSKDDDDDIKRCERLDTGPDRRKLQTVLFLYDRRFGYRDTKKFKMSLVSLKIQGIRSYGDTAQNIKFDGPLTLIVGRNGCGKTTIIECLRYATTGEMPPNSKGGAFIHDPSIGNGSRVNSQVTLKFKDHLNREFASRRSSVLLVKNKKNEFKTVENLIVMKNPDTEKFMTFSQRCVNADEFVTSSLGVSSAILSNVIFCHQEDSNW